MKRFLFLTAFAAVLCMSCIKHPVDPVPEDESIEYNYSEPKIEAPANQLNHFSAYIDPSLSQEGMKNPAGEADKIIDITLPPGLTGIVEFEKAGPQAIDFQYVGSKISAGVTFQTTGAFQFLTITGIDGDQISMSAKVDGADVNLNGTVRPEPEYSCYRQDVCRNWLIEETFLEIRGEGVSQQLGAGLRFNGCSLSEITKEVSVKSGLNLDPLDPEYDIKKIMIDPSGKFGLIFQGAAPYYGDYTLKGTTMTYNLPHGEQPQFAGTAFGKLTSTNGYGRLEIKADIKEDTGKKYSVGVIFKMKSEPRR